MDMFSHKTASACVHFSFMTITSLCEQPGLQEGWIEETERRTGMRERGIDRVVRHVKRSVICSDGGMGHGILSSWGGERRGRKLLDRGSRELLP